MSNVKPLDASVLYQETDLSELNFNTTNDLIELKETIGQPRAMDAVQFGVGIQQEGYNIYALGPPGMGKRSLIRRFFEERAKNEPVPSDWCYVYNFEQQHKPNAIQLPPGKGDKFRKEMENLVEELRSALTTAFESDEYRNRKQVIEQEVQEQQEGTLDDLQKRAREQNFALLRTPAGIIFAPMRDDSVISPEEFQGLPEEERNAIEAKLETFQNELKGLLQEVPLLQRRLRDGLSELNREVINFAVGPLMDEMKGNYGEYPAIVEYLDAVREDVIENANEFIQQDEEGEGAQGGLTALLMARARSGQPSPFQRYKVNLLVDNSKLEGAPVITEDNPTYQNLIGQVEHIAQMGALLTDFTLIKAGSLHLANGGYLILDVRKVLTQPYAWEALKRSLERNQIKIESIGQMLSMISTVTLDPEPIPLKVKVALFGERDIYYLLANLDPDFAELFKVQADFEEQMERNNGNQQLYARLITSLVEENDLKPFDRSAVARVIEHSARMVSDSERLSLNVHHVADVMREADYWASQKDGANGIVTAADVQLAIEKQIFRSDRLRERVFETILRGTFLIDTQGEVVGQVNGLSVIQLSGFSFGRPSRITARVSMGRGEVVDIEREVELSGPIHSKGVLILSGFLGARYATDKPLSLSASLVFEQSYGGVDGDSASSAELYALLSAIAERPLKQSLAVTGAINQHGQVQAIGGVNEKIEGFFDICKARGLSGEQGVLIPASNVKHLMLRKDVVDAVRQEKFFIYPVEHVDQGIELLTGMPAGEPDEDGKYPSGTINGLVQARLESMAEKRQELNQKKELES